MKLIWMLCLLLVTACSPAQETDPAPVLTERAYAWYLSQEESGPFAADNCGPAVSAMALRWYDAHSELSVEQARSQYKAEGGWWYTADIEAILTAYGVPVRYQAYVSTGDLIKVLEGGHIAILCIDTRFITPRDENNSRIGRHYTGDFGHFVIAKGYRKIEDELYIEVYDPWNADSFYADGTPKGKDRLYPAQEVDLAIRNWWSQLMVIGEEAEK